MKTLKITTSITILNLILFISVSSNANPFAGNTGDIAKKSVNNQIEAVKSTIVDKSSTTSLENEFIHLRFDVNKFNTEDVITELPLNSMDYLRFNANKYSNATASELTELPVINDFDYLRFDVNKYSIETAVAIDELPVE